ncbi:N6-L-threonylcarbamoyladenine synthase [Planifilum fimeticola]|uniref:N(6)-L-threonylcarbamoyladenine synthase n=1 Tax=Planifilum fimeticola TaxID=201975 RepID=A0A2T0LCW8_9BACL|nr:O-sialoglycoprotein endopeptidase [Planifilum fimeticola]PRX39814.1 N6-L-threonylcarbamoyladenine synthase [Planifilum fimeticola]
MGKRPAVLGIDTSNYFTSLCLVDEEGNPLFDERKGLEVPRGERGLQQSTAVFGHVRNLPRLLSRMNLQDVRVVAVSASRAPRPQEESYMPVFEVGLSWGFSLSKAWGIPFCKTTHQEGHIAAGVATASPPLTENSFLAVHLSGGTTELLQVAKKDEGYEINRLGGTRDLNAGQLVDRVGVAMGLPFPAGPTLEKLALGYEGSPVTVASAVRGLDCSFSGPETALLRMWEKGELAPEGIAFATLRCIANTLERWLLNAFRSGYCRTVLIVGGVAANGLIRERLRLRLEHPAVGARLHFADPRYSGDNGFGVARIGLEMWRRQSG